jgi:CRP/FNR family transcriptional regulator, cyclic AMP receptor protein
MAAEPRAFLPLGSAHDTHALHALRSARRVDAGANDAVPCPEGRVVVVVRGATVVHALADDGAAFVDVSGPDDLIGAGSFLSTPRWSGLEVRALVPATAICVSAAEAWSLAGARPDVARWLVLALSRETVRSDRRAALLRTFPVGRRVSGILADLACRFGRSVTGGTAIPLPLTQELLASMAGATRESVNRALRDLRGSGEIRRAGGAYVVTAASPTRAKATDPSARSDLATVPSDSSLSR